MTDKRRRLAVTRLWYEGNAFCLLPATAADFERREWLRGEDALRAARNTATELAAVCDFIDSQPDWEVSVSRCASAVPSGKIVDSVFTHFLEEVLEDFKAGAPWDAIYLSLHGASITDRRDEPEVDLLRALRREFPDTPIAASFDLHANHATVLTDLLTFAVGYKTYPHVDMREVAARALSLLARTASGEIRPVGALRNDGYYLSSVNMCTDQGPMAELQALARELTVAPVLDISVFGGFAYANSPNIGASVMAYADDDLAAARIAVEKVYGRLLELLPAFDIPLLGADEALERALAVPGLVAVTDAADNPLSGGIGDTPGLLRALMKQRIEEPVVFAAFADQALVQRAQRQGLGATLTVSLGGRLTSAYGPPVKMQAQVERLTDGRFRNSGPMENGVTVDCGPSVVLRHGQLHIIVTSFVQPSNDPAFFALHGIDLKRTRLLCVKAKNHFRAAFLPRCARIVDADIPGPATLDLASLGLRRKHATNPS